MSRGARGATDLRASVLDRLMKPPGGRRGELDSIGLRELEAAVARDLDWLLNSRRLIESLQEYPEARESVLNYGLPDLSTRSWRNSSDASEIGLLIEETIRRFEPRLRPRSVKVTSLPAGAVDEFRLRFRIDAVLYVEPIQAPVSFDTDLDFTGNRIQVRGGI